MAQGRVLIVDDEPDLVESLEFALLAKGYDVQMATDGLEGMKSAQENPPNLMVLDVMLPGCNGYEVSRQLKNWMDGAPEGNSFPILLLTARKVGTPEREDFVATWSRADEVLYKPFELDELMETVESLLAGQAVMVD